MSSKRRLRFTSSNASPALISQFGLTYHETIPDGRTVKKHLHAFLAYLLRRFPGFGYLWILEFQSRGVPHLHLFLTIPYSWEEGRRFGAAWNRIAEPGSKKHRRFHQHEKNFISWNMGSGSYLCKYLDKESQKVVPDGFTGVGRFWGNSRGLVPDPLIFSSYDLDLEYSHKSIDKKTGEVEEFRAADYFTRLLCRHHEKSLGRSPWRSSAKKRPTSYTLPNSAGVFFQSLFWVEEEKKKRLTVP